ncbi:MAG: hypothetical protein JO272_07180 [Pseudonocardiales bacterium]|nr:hypothetical protein [Pseudonocardiales bacterium]
MPPGSARPLAQSQSIATETSTLAEALDALVGAEGTGAPALTADAGRLVGWTTHRIILTAVQPPPRPAAWQGLSGVLSQ